MAEKAIVSREKLVAVADAVRSKTGDGKSLTLDAVAKSVLTLDTALDVIMKKIEVVDWDEITILDNTHFFYRNASIKKVRLENVVSLGGDFFRDCKKLLSVELPNCVTIGSSFCAYTGSVTSVYLPFVETMGTYSFISALGLKVIDLPKAKSFGDQSFRQVAVDALILRSDAVATLGGTNCFRDSSVSRGGGYIYVPSVLVEEYKVATNWTTYASQIRAIEDYPEITGG